MSPSVPRAVVLIADTGNAVIRQVDTDGIITTICGNGNVGTSGDDVATTLAMSSPFGVAVDSSGNLYVAEFGTNRIRKIDTSGKITTAIGDGIQGFAGDGGPANKVEMSLPTSVAVDSSGNVYFADSLNNRIRKLSGGNVSTFAGNGVLSRSGDGGAATSAQLNTPLGVAVDPAAPATSTSPIPPTTWCAAWPNGVISTFAGTGTAGSSGDGSAATSAQLNGPQGLAVDTAGNLYIADTQNHRVRKVTGGTISTVAGSGTAGFAGDGGAAGSAQLNASLRRGGGCGRQPVHRRVRQQPRAQGGRERQHRHPRRQRRLGLRRRRRPGRQRAASTAHSPSPWMRTGNVYIADTANNRVRKVASNGVITTVAGNGAAGFSGDGGPAVNAHGRQPGRRGHGQRGQPVHRRRQRARAQDVPFRHHHHHRRQRHARLFGRRRHAAERRLNGPSAVAVNAAGSVYVADTFNNAVRLLQFSGSRHHGGRRDQRRQQSERSRGPRRSDRDLRQRPRPRPARAVSGPTPTGACPHRRAAPASTSMAWLRRCSTPRQTRWRRWCPPASTDRWRRCTCKDAHREHIDRSRANGPHSRCRMNVHLGGRQIKRHHQDSHSGAEISAVRRHKNRPPIRTASD